MNSLRTIRLQSEAGFTMAIVMGVLLLTSTLGLAAWAAGRGDIRTSQFSKDRKQAYAAAEAGVNWYQSRLSADNAYWSKCTSVPDVSTGVPAPVNQQWNGTGTDPRRWRKIPGSTAEYTIELLPAPGKTSCSTAVTDGTANMIDPSSGTFRIRATGRFGGKKRSIIAKFRRARFLDFLWFTDYETTDPLAYAPVVLQASPRYTQVDWANDNCGLRYRSSRNRSCMEIQFASFDKVLGPLHSNDSLLICDQATFGRTGTSDKVESSQYENTATTGSPSPGWRPCSSGSVTPNFQTPPFRHGQPTMQMPATNTQIFNDVLPNYLFKGETIIELKANHTIDITNALKNGGAKFNTPWPSNGIIYVDTQSCGSSEPPVNQHYNVESTGCANAVVKGTYADNITVASRKDIVINGNLQRSGDVMAGLVAEQFVRVYHPASGLDSTGDCDESTDQNFTTGANARYGPYFSTVTIEAAILSLNHSFTADNYACGPGLANLNITGAIAQRYRGAVGQGGSGVGTTPTHGFVKNYVYDDRLKYRNPPDFLTPVNAAWRLLSSNEQIPAK
jgi:hypothetical protein